MISGAEHGVPGAPLPFSILSTCGFWILRGLQWRGAGGGWSLKLQRCPRGDRRFREQQRLPAVAPEGRKHHPPRPWPGRHPAARPPFSREEVGDTGKQAQGTDGPPRLGPLTFLLRKHLQQANLGLHPVPKIAGTSGPDLHVLRKLLRAAEQ